MPNYNDRRYNAESARRDADDIVRRYGRNPRTMPHIMMLLDAADKWEGQNERGEMRDERDEMRRGNYTRNDYTSNDYTRDEYEHPEMRRRRGRSGRYIKSDYDNDTSMDYTQSNGDYNMQPRRPQPYLMDNQGYQSQNIIPYNPYYAPPYMHQGQSDMQQGQGGMHQGQSQGGMQQDHQSRKIGFGSTGQHHQQYNGVLKEIDQYYQDYMRHKSAYDQSQDPTEKQHMLMEMKELSQYFMEFLEKIYKDAKTPEEKQYMQQMIQQAQQKFK